MLQLLIFFVIGFDLRNGKKSPVRVARIEGKNIIEGGLHWVRLAALLNLTLLPVRVVEYDYISLRKRMFVTVQREGALVGITSREKDL